MPRRGHQLGLSLIEMMVALVVGLVVSGAALALVAAVTKSNSETIRATGLTQELRTTSEIIARDFRRARNVSDPISNVSTTPLLGTCNTIDISTAGCVRFGYDCSTTSNGTFKSIGLVGNKVRVLTSSTGVPACPASNTGVQISTDAIKVNSMVVSQPDSVNRPDAYSVQLTGQFLSDPSSTSPLIRTITQEIQIRSSAVQ